MNSKILIANTTLLSSTSEVALAIKEGLSRVGASVDFHGIEEITDLSGYNPIVVGATVIMGWHTEAVKFVQRHQESPKQRQVAYYFSA